MHDGCLWLGAPIPITDMLIHRIMLLPHEGLNRAKEFGGKTSERDLEEKTKENLSFSRSHTGTP